MCTIHQGPTTAAHTHWVCSPANGRGRSVSLLRAWRRHALTLLALTCIGRRLWSGISEGKEIRDSHSENLEISRYLPGYRASGRWKHVNIQLQARGPDQCICKQLLHATAKDYREPRIRPLSRKCGCWAFTGWHTGGGSPLLSCSGLSLQDSSIRGSGIIQLQRRDRA